MKRVYVTGIAFLFLFSFFPNIAKPTFSGCTTDFFSSPGDCSSPARPEFLVRSPRVFCEAKCIEGSRSIEGCGEYKADLIIFSYDRPLQLYALLESVHTQITGLASVCVLYRASNAEYDHAYNQVYADFPWVTTLKQGANPKADFKPLTLQAFAAGATPYILFAVDDIIVTDHVCVADCTRALETAQAYGFYLRLGLNLDYCYSMGGPQALPNLAHIISTQKTVASQTPEAIYSWRFALGQHDWGYPHTVDMTIYRKKDIERDLLEMTYSSPNTLEAQWSMRAAAIQNRQGLCYQQTKMVNLPLNRVQHDYANRAMNSLAPAELLALFMNNKKMAIDPLHKIKNKSAHMEYAPEFIAR